MAAPIPCSTADTQRIFNTLKSGGIALCPTDLGYALMSDAYRIGKIFVTKNCAAEKRHPMMGSYMLHKELHVLSPERADMVRLLAQDLKLPLAVVAKYRPEHRVIQTLGDGRLEASTADGAIVMMMGTGSVSEEVTRLCEAEGLVMQGSSANLSGTGNKFSLAAVPREIRDIADIELDYGLAKYWYYGRGSTMIDFSKEQLEVVRIGACYGVIKDALKRFWNADLPEDPGKDVLPSGGLMQLPPSETLTKLIEKTKSRTTG